MTPRPRFTRHETDVHGSNDMAQDSQGAVGETSKSSELRKLDLENSRDIESGHSDEDSSSGVDAGDGFRKVDAPIATAKDLVTNVLHVDDDPNLSPYTFRLLFLGTS